jgi:two-component system chemotaxis sensor kinase CheA
MSAATENSNELIADFVDEALQSLRTLPGLFAAYRETPGDPAPIHAIFRAVHSVKGCAGFLDLTAIKLLAHSLENTLDEVRKEKISLTQELERSLVKGFDSLDMMLQRASEGFIESELTTEESRLLAEVHRVAEAARKEDRGEAEVLAELVALAEEMAAAGLPESQMWSERLRDLLPAEAARSAADHEDESTAATPATATTMSAARFAIGGEEVSELVSELLAPFVAMDAARYQEADAHSFCEQAVGFAALCARGGREDLSRGVLAAAADLKTLLDSPLDVDAMLLSIVWDKLRPVLDELRIVEADAPEAEAKAVGGGDGVPEKAAAENPSAAKLSATQRNKNRVIRIKEERVDEFLESVSGLFLMGELYKDVQSRMDDQSADEKDLGALVEELRQINNAFAAQSASLQRSVVALRRVAAAGLLSKFPQMARGLATQLGKRIDVHISGEEVEIDKSLVEDLDAPMAHLIRNVLDHALEMPEERLIAGKTEVGNLWLKIELTKTHVIITIRDDGRGINPAVLRRKAVEKEILTEAQAHALSDQDAIQLIFNAGFSTASQVSDISGRGVGMDVVRTKLREHNGEVIVESTVGVGTTFQLIVPVREAVLVIDGLLVRHGTNLYIVPFEHVLEIAELGAKELRPVQGAHVAMLRGESYDAVSLSELLNLPAAADASDDGKSIGVLVGGKQGSLCLMVDAVMGHRQVVVNNIKKLLPGSDRVAGVAQLGGGRLALVLSVQDMIDARVRSARQGTHRRGAMA